jgi:hypothetical protein
MLRGLILMSAAEQPMHEHQHKETSSLFSLADKSDIGINLRDRPK